MTTLAINTIGSACEAAVLKDGSVLAKLSEPMQRGHDVHLPGVVKQSLEMAGLQFQDINRIGVVCGPGSFTGVRVGVSFARGLGIALGLTVIGVTSLEAALPKLAALNGDWVGVLPAKKRPPGLSWWTQKFENGQQIEPPMETDIDQMADLLANISGVFGDTSSLNGLVESSGQLVSSSIDVERVALFSASAEPELHPPKPAYVRPPDAAPPKSNPLLLKKGEQS